MMTKNEVKLLRAFLIESKMTQKEFAKEAGICERTLRTAIKTGKVSDKTYCKILDAMLAETIQYNMIAPVKEDKMLKVYKFALQLSIAMAIVLGAFIIARLFI